MKATTIAILAAAGVAGFLVYQRFERAAAVAGRAKGTAGRLGYGGDGVGGGSGGGVLGKIDGAIDTLNQGIDVVDRGRKLYGDVKGWFS